MGSPATCTEKASYCLVDGTLVGTCEELKSAMLNHTIDQTEQEATIPPTYVWTGADAAGQALGIDCSKWMSSFSDGFVGSTEYKNSYWSYISHSSPCSDMNPIYCFEQ